MRLAFALLLCCGFMSAQHRTPIDRAPAAVRSAQNPFAGQEPAIRAGGKLYRRECASCHGSKREGSGSAPPLAQPRIRHAEPGALFWVLRNGSIYRGMPSFAHLPEPQRWQIVTYLRSDYLAGTPR